MNKFVQHIPEYIYDSRDPSPPVYEFETTDELLKLEVVQHYKNNTPLFSHFAIDRNCLMVISDEGFHWWVVGYISNPDSIDLPRWAGPRYRAELPSGKKVILEPGQVFSSCGDELRLFDGTIAKNICKGE